jgi:hypothetical protein
LGWSVRCNHCGVFYEIGVNMNKELLSLIINDIKRMKSIHTENRIDDIRVHIIIQHLKKLWTSLGYSQKDLEDL